MIGLLYDACFYIRMYYEHVVLRNGYTHVESTCIALRRVLTLQESQGLTTYVFVMLLLVMISLAMLTFRLMVTMVAEFCSLVNLIHITLIMISSI